MRRPATRAASRPSVSPSAFTTCQRLSISPAFMLYVFIRFIVKQTVLIANLHQAEPPSRGRATGRPRPGLPQHRLELLRGELPPPYFHQGRGEAGDPAGEGGGRPPRAGGGRRPGRRRKPFASTSSVRRRPRRLTSARTTRLQVLCRPAREG